MLRSPRLTPPLKWHGGKHYLAPKIVSLMPPHLHYVEPYFGGGSVLLFKNPEGISEVVNDLCLELTTFWRVLKHEDLFAQFQRIVEATPFSQDEWDNSWEPTSCPVEAAVRFFVRCRQSRAGQMANFATLTRNRLRRGMNEQVSAWMGVVEGLPAVAARLKRVVILHDDALNVIRSQDGPNTLFYLDPPYLHETRRSTSVYEHEMTDDDHSKLLHVVNEVEGHVILSGYRSELYDTMLSGPRWRRKDIDVPNHVAAGSSKRRETESLWMNYPDAD